MERLNASSTKNAADLESESDRALWRLCEMFRADLEGLRSLIEEHLRESLQLITKMKTAASKGELSSVKFAAHTLKSNALVFGELALSRACAALEISAATNAKENIDSMIHKLSCEQERGRIVLLAKYRVLVNAIASR